jgi:hypothetical protein
MSDSVFLVNDDGPVTSELVRVDPPRAWGVRGIDDPIRATADSDPVGVHLANTFAEKSATCSPLQPDTTAS